MSTAVSKILEMYPFLDKASASEPNIDEVITEIIMHQQRVEKGVSATFATRKQIYKSRNIKMQFTPSRDKNLAYLLEHLTSRFPDYVSSLVTFKVEIDDKSKKLIALEMEEFCYNLTADELERLQSIRDKKSMESILSLIARFRVFNLTKLMKSVKSKKLFNRVLQKAINKDIFIYRQTEIVRNKVMPTQEICFHQKNYKFVKESLKLEDLKNIILSHRELILPRISNYGIKTTDVNDYQETKVDYLLHILLEDMKGMVGTKDVITLENFKSLRDCIIKVDNALDPTKIHNDEILNAIKEGKVVTASDVAVTLMSVDETTVKNWAKPEVLKKEHVISLKSSNNQLYLIYGPTLPQEFKKQYSFLRYEYESYQAMSQLERESFSMQLDTLYNGASHAVSSQNPGELLGISNDEVEGLKELLDEYNSWNKQKELRNELSSKEISNEKGGNFLGTIAGVIKAIFSLFSSDDDHEVSSVKRSKKSKKSSSRSDAESTFIIETKKRPMLKQSQNLYNKLRNKNTPIIALSEHVTLSKENDEQVDTIINDLRDNNLKIIMPLYNARKALYPKRSSKLLIPDIEYLLIEPSVIATSESITKYIDSLVGLKLREDVIPGNTLLQIEKYLRNIHRQQRAKLRNLKGHKEEKSKKASQHK
jgi:hypothetical protein